ncbi:MAG: DUF4258 domain-containing protein [Gammaproteobacteria bacterium]|nr:DUF4258 domain-containing protein [Gammaproteobacteria bacterium]
MKELSNSQLTEMIRKRAADTGNVVLTKHAKSRMKLRKITEAEVHATLRNGRLEDPPELAPNGGLTATMAYFYAGRKIGVVVGLVETDGLPVVTVLCIKQR